MAVATRPLFRQDLLAEAIDEGGARFVDVMDDSTGVVFRFYEAEYSLACGMDGSRDVDAIVAWADTELGLRPKPTEVQSIIAKLDELGYLGEAKADAAATDAATAAAMAGIAVPSTLTMGWDAVADPTATAASENPHEVITTPTAKVDLDEPIPLAPPPSKPEIVTPSSNPGIAVTTSSPGIARVGVVSVPAAKAVVPVKPRTQTPVPAAAASEDEEATKIASDEELAMGVVVAPPSSSPRIPVENLELGHVDRSTPVAAASEAPSGLDLELGSSGQSEKAAQAPAAKTEDLGLGVAGPGAMKKEPVSEVSIALADHAAIDASDVRDAVRASQVMKAVNPDDVEALEKEAAAEAAAAKAAEIAKDDQKHDQKDAPKDDLAAAREKRAADKAAADRATYEGRRLPIDEKKATAVESDEPRPSKLKWLLAVAVLAAGAALVYNFGFKKSDSPPAASEKSAADIAAEKAAADQAAAAKAAEDKAAADKLAADKLAAEKAEAERLAAEQAAAGGSGSAGSADAGSGSADPAAEKAAAEKLAAEKLAAEKLAAEKLAAEQAATEAAAAEKLAAEKAAADKAAAEAAATDKAAADKAAADKAAADKAAADKAAADKAAADKAAADKAAADKAAAGGTDDAAKKAARAKARAAREKAEMEKLLERQRKALEERKKQQEAGGGAAPTP